MRLNRRCLLILTAWLRLAGVVRVHRVHMAYVRLSLCFAALACFAVSAAAADPVALRAGSVTYAVDPATLKIDVRPDGAAPLMVMPPLHAPEAVAVTPDGTGWRWTDAEGRNITLSTEGEALRLTISGARGSSLAWPLPTATTGTWLIPDGEGMAYKVDDPFWRAAHKKEKCLGGTTLLSFPAWSYLTEAQAVTYALGDGLLSDLCLHDQDGLQARLKHDFADGAETLDLLFALRPAEPLAPALFYRQVLKSRGQLKSFAAKAVPGLPRLFGAPQAYVWGDGRDLAFLDDLKALGVERIVLGYDQDPRTHKHLVGPAYLAKANALGYLAGPYEAFDNGQPEATADTPSAIWNDGLYPSGCLRDAGGKVVVGFANRGCEMSSEAIARHPGSPSPASRYAGHIADGASQVFVDVDAFGVFYDDHSPDHPMSMARDRANRLARLAVAIDQFRLVLGSENVTAWSSGVAHYSHGTAQARALAVWPIQADQSRFGVYWPSDRPAFFFAPFKPTADEARALFGAADRLPLFEAVFHDSVVSADRWEFGLMKVAGEERRRFARSLLYGTPTMWNLDRRELARVGPWLKAAQDDFRQAHGVGAPALLTGFRWLTPDHLVQQVTYADGRVLIANFGDAAWQGVASDCVRVIRPGRPRADLCPPADPSPFH
ncbi:Glycosyl hydrolases related to GH101 family, GHL1-GHL3 [Caulobacter sp. UNC279MFTsu5.1]|nr:Glycosyl hydrolases related to GH101 family, GHL1-GHL3 [Caulobacter sp. UNC279MFTsu5.1]